MDEMNEDGGGQGVKKSGQQRGTENVESVVAYLDQLDKAGEMVPLNAEGGPNYSEIARHCGFGRQVFYTNEKAVSYTHLMHEPAHVFEKIARRAEEGIRSASFRSGLRSPRPRVRLEGRHCFAAHPEDSWAIGIEVSPYFRDASGRAGYAGEADR